LAPLLDTVKEFLEADSWHYKDVPEMGILTMNFRGESGQWSCYVHARDDRGLVAFYSISPTRPTPDKLQAMCEYLTRANYSMVIGNFEMDIDDGEIRFKTSIDVTGDELTVPLIRQLVYANLLTMDKYLPGITSVTYSDETPAEAIAKIEQAEE